LEIEHLASAAHLPETGDSRLGVETTEVMVFVILEIGLEEWAWANERHLANQHVGKLRQLVEAPATEEATQTRRAWIVTDLEQATVSRIIEMRQLLLLDIG